MKMKISNFAHVPEPVGLEDRGHVILSCSNCGQGLVDIWLIKSNPALKWKGKARCWKCGDQSFIREWTGQFAPGHYGKDREGADPDGQMESRVESVFVKIESEGDVLVFHTKKPNVV